MFCYFKLFWEVFAFHYVFEIYVLLKQCAGMLSKCCVGNSDTWFCVSWWCDTVMQTFDLTISLIGHWCWFFITFSISNKMSWTSLTSLILNSLWKVELLINYRKDVLVKVNPNIYWKGIHLNGAKPFAETYTCANSSLMNTIDWLDLEQLYKNLNC